uniref:Uncharacterized protein n=1 Tax=Macrococcoides canis TaxID=1855823 RepID=A0A4Y5T5P9_9STAP|nr:hypothetical protein [Macrococcus canis]
MNLSLIIFYHLGSREKNRNEVLEVIMVKKGN